MQWLRKLFDPALSPKSRLLRALLLALLTLACGYRIWLVFQYNPLGDIWSDPARHWYLGIRPLDTQPMAAIDPIGYQIYVGVLAKLTVHSPLLVAYWTALLSLSGPWLWYRYLRELLAIRDWALAGWVILKRYPFDGRHDPAQALSTAGRRGRVIRTRRRPAVGNACFLHRTARSCSARQRRSNSLGVR
jgi:hypothetical protein